MAYEINWTFKARKDFNKIVLYIEENTSSVSAEKFRQRTIQRTEQISISPESGIQSQKNKGRFKIFLQEYHYIIYKVEKKSIFILQIFDARQHPNKLKF